MRLMVTTKDLQTSPRWRTLGLPVRVEKNPNQSQGGYVLTIERRRTKAANSIRDKVRSNEGFARALGFKGFYETKQEAMRMYRERHFRHYVTYRMDKRFKLETNPNALPEGSPAPTPHASPAKAGRPRKRQRPTITPLVPDAVNEELITGQEWRAKMMARLRRALVLNRIADLLPGPPGHEEDYDEEAIHITRLRAMVLLEYLQLIEAGTTADKLHDLATQAGQLLAPDYTVTDRTVREWFYDFAQDGYLPQDMRGRWKRDVLVMEEDIARKLRKWMLNQVKGETLDVGRSSRPFSPSSSARDCSPAPISSMNTASSSLSRAQPPTAGCTSSAPRGTSTSSATTTTSTRTRPSSPSARCTWRRNCCSGCANRCGC